MKEPPTSENGVFKGLLGRILAGPHSEIVRHEEESKAERPEPAQTRPQAEARASGNPEHQRNIVMRALGWFDQRLKAGR